MSGVSDILARAAQRLDRAAAVKNTLNGKEGSAKSDGRTGFGVPILSLHFWGDNYNGPLLSWLPHTDRLWFDRCICHRL